MPTYPLTDIEKKAWKFAKEAHGDTKRKFSNVSYFDGHVAKVFGFVKQFDTRPEVGAAAILHDVLEDVDEVTYEILVEEFGKEIADLVKELTSTEEILDVMGKPDYILDKMYSMSEKALIIKLCDRLHNISDYYSSSDSFREKYYKETSYIVEGLKERHLNRIQRRILERIEGILSNIKNRYKYESFRYIKRFNTF